MPFKMLPMPPPTVVAGAGYRRRVAEACCPASIVPLRFRYLPRGMPLAREQRKLAAIVAADVVGYSRLMGRDESGNIS
jgi:class 3 adenylate cyclase